MQLKTVSYFSSICSWFKKVNKQSKEYETSPLLEKKINFNLKTKYNFSIFIEVLEN